MCPLLNIVSLCTGVSTGTEYWYRKDSIVLSIGWLACYHFSSNNDAAADDVVSVIASSNILLLVLCVSVSCIGR